MLNVLTCNIGIWLIKHYTTDDLVKQIYQWWGSEKKSTDVAKL